MLTRQELLLVRNALACWSQAELGHPIPSVSGNQVPQFSQHQLDPTEVERLYNRLAIYNMKFVVVDTVLNHVVNTRLFEAAPQIYPSNGRWQVRSVIA